jgi:hypothetical protein
MDSSKTFKELEIIRMGEFDDRAIETALEGRNSRNLDYEKMSAEGGKWI